MSKLFPQKHISLEQSYMGFGAQLISLIGCGVLVDDLWQDSNNKFNVKHSFNDFILTLDYLYLIGIIKINQEGKICLS